MPPMRMGTGWRARGMSTKGAREVYDVVVMFI